jgi:hypothetical protein
MLYAKRENPDFTALQNNRKPVILYTQGKGKVIPVQVVEAFRVVRGWGSHIFRHSANRSRQGCKPYAPVAF